MQACQGPHINLRILSNLKMLRNHFETDERDAFWGEHSSATARPPTSGKTVAAGTHGGKQDGNMDQILNVPKGKK